VKGWKDEAVRANCWAAEGLTATPVASVRSSCGLRETRQRPPASWSSQTVVDQSGGTAPVEPATIPTVQIATVVVR